MTDLTATCPQCDAYPGERCTTRSGLFARRPHKVRRQLTAHADAALDALFPKVGPCGFCGLFDQRHRVIDAMAGMLAAGEDPEVVAEEFGRTPEAVDVVTAWAKRWPGAWL
jgi:hypothetical protein